MLNSKQSLKMGTETVHTFFALVDASPGKFTGFRNLISRAWPKVVASSDQPEGSIFSSFISLWYLCQSDPIPCTHKLHQKSWWRKSDNFMLTSASHVGQTRGQIISQTCPLCIWFFQSTREVSVWTSRALLVAVSHNPHWTVLDPSFPYFLSMRQRNQAPVDLALKKKKDIFEGECSDWRKSGRNLLTRLDLTI